MGYYQGKALEARRAVRPRGTVLGRTLRVLGVLAAAAVLAHVPWEGLRHRFAVVTEVRVEGARYLDAQRVGEVAGIHLGDDLFHLSLPRARQALLLDSRIAEARVTRRLPRGVRVRLEERLPVLLVDHGVPWEMDSSGVLLAPLERGVVADVPLLVGTSFRGLPAGTQVESPAVRRGLAWVRSLLDREVELGAQVSEVDVSDPDATGLTLVGGTRVLAPAWPSRQRLSALRVVLADLKQRGTRADELDLRFDRQVIVRPATPTPGDTHSG